MKEKRIRERRNEKVEKERILHSEKKTTPHLCR